MYFIQYKNWESYLYLIFPVCGLVLCKIQSNLFLTRAKTSKSSKGQEANKCQMIGRRNLKMYLLLLSEREGVCMWGWGDIIMILTIENHRYSQRSISQS